MTTPSLIRRTSTAFALSGMLVALAACGGGDGDTDSSSDSGSNGGGSGGAAESEYEVPAEYAESGSVTVGLAVGNPPWAVLPEGEDQPEGFDIDVITALSERLGLEPQLEVAGFDTLLTGLQADRYDIVISSLTIREERIEVVDMLGYVQIGTGILVAAGNPEGVESIEDLCGLKVGVAKGSANQEPVDEAQADCDTPVEIVQTEGNDFVALQSGRVDAMVLDAAGAFETANSRGEEFEAVEGEVYGAGIAGIAFNKENTELSGVYQQALQDMIEDGEYAEILDRWGVSDLAYEEAELNPSGE
jgi:polar amino acid transport system substrate-binding protein